MGLFLGWRHRLICIVLSLCKHACKEVCDINPGIDPFPLLARSWNRRWPDFLTFTACKTSRLGLRSGKKALCISNRCKDLFIISEKKYFGVRCTLNIVSKHNSISCIVKLLSQLIKFWVADLLINYISLGCESWPRLWRWIFCWPTCLLWKSLLLWKMLSVFAW